MAKGRVGDKGRTRARFALALVGFLAIAVGVILRRTYGIAGARELHELETRRTALANERLRMEAEVRAAASRARLQPIAEQRLQLRVPSDSQVIIIPRVSHDGP